MPRAIWSGSISFGLVNAPVKMYSAIDENDLELHLVHEKDGSPIGYEKVCKKEGKEVPADEIVKAYEVADGELVYLEDDDFAAAEEEGYRTIQVLDFVQRDDIDPIVFQRSYYLGPAEGADKVYLLLLRAMEESGLSAIVEYVFHQKQQLGCLRVRDGLIVLEAMYFADEIRPVKGIAPKRSSKVDKNELEMAQTLIDRFTSEFEHEQVRGQVPQAPAEDRAAQAARRRGARARPPNGRRRRSTCSRHCARASMRRRDGKNGRAKARAGSKRRKATARKG